MKTTTVLSTLAFALMFGAGSLTAQVDLVPGINYSYNPPGANGILEVVNQDACNNGSSGCGSFDVANYIYNTSTHNAYVIGDTTLSSGIAGNACITLYNRYMDINNTPGIPAGTYQLGIWVNSQHSVSETDTTNNVGLFDGTFSFSPTGINEVKADQAAVSFFPNPGNGVYTLKSDKSLAGCTLKVYSTTGQKVYNAPLVAGQNQIDLDGAAKGVYFYNILNTEGAFVASGKLVKQ